MMAKHSSAPVIIRATAFQTRMPLLSLNFDSQVRSWTFERALLFLFLLSLPLVNPWIRGDGVGYYAYARAPLIEHSLDFTHDYQGANESFRETRFDDQGHVRPEYITGTG